MLKNLVKTPKRTSSLAKSLRKRMTSGEMALWKHLRAKRFLGFKFRRQVPLGPYIVDFLCIEKNIIIEIDGDSHEHQNAILHDQKRDSYFQSLGFRTIRFGNGNAKKSPDDILTCILQALQDSVPSPCPSPDGRGNVVIPKSD